MVIPGIVKTILRSAAPTLLTAIAIPPPFGLIASAVVSGVLKKYLPDNPAQPAIPLTPQQITNVVVDNAGNPDLVKDLQEAELALKKYELESGVRFAEIVVEDKRRAGDFQVASGTSQAILKLGTLIIFLAIACDFLIVFGILAVMVWNFTIPADKANIAMVAFSLIGTVVGFFNSIAGVVISFYWGSSQGSKEKDQSIGDTLQTLGTQLGKAIPVTHPTPPSVAPVTAPTVLPPDTIIVPAIPASPDLLLQIIANLAKNHQHFKDGVSWALKIDGLSIDGADPTGTPGSPVTIGTIWSRYGDFCCASSKRYGVPVELIVATIAVESNGNPNARRSEPALKTESVGLMQTLVTTAIAATGKRNLTGDDLLSPQVSIDAGTAYIAQQRSQTHFDPPLVAASYNAGSLRRDDGQANRWKLLVYPTGTGRYIDNFAAWFTDAMRLSNAQEWGKSTGIVSFASTIQNIPKT